MRVSLLLETAAFFTNDSEVQHNFPSPFSFLLRTQFQINTPSVTHLTDSKVRKAAHPPMKVRHSLSFTETRLVVCTSTEISAPSEADPLHACFYRAACTVGLNTYPLRTPVLVRVADQPVKPHVCLQGACSPPTQHWLKLNHDESHTEFSHLLISFGGFRHKHYIAIAIGETSKGSFHWKQIQSNTSHQWKLRPTFQGSQKVSEELPVCISVAISLGLWIYGYRSPMLRNPQGILIIYPQRSLRTVNLQGRQQTGKRTKFLSYRAFALEHLASLSKPWFVQPRKNVASKISSYNWHTPLDGSGMTEDTRHML